jgi:hypothetical protein
MHRCHCSSVLLSVTLVSRDNFFLFTPMLHENRPSPPGGMPPTRVRWSGHALPPHETRYASKRSYPRSDGHVLADQHRRPSGVVRFNTDEGDVDRLLLDELLHVCQMQCAHLDGEFRHLAQMGNTQACGAPFAEAFAHRRCVIPANGFYEWTGPKYARQPFWINRGDGTSSFLL